jgi:hypothetical protein
VRASVGEVANAETALDRVVASLSPEARLELLSYATKVAEPMPPESSSWYVVGVVQVNAAQRLSLVTLSDQVKTGSAILTGLSKVAAALPRFATLSTAIAGLAVVVALTLALAGWRTGYDRGWDAANHQNLMGYNAYACRALANVRHVPTSARSRSPGPRSRTDAARLLRTWSGSSRSARNGARIAADERL